MVTDFVHAVRKAENIGFFAKTSTELYLNSFILYVNQNVN